MKAITIKSAKLLYVSVIIVLAYASPVFASAPPPTNKAVYVKPQTYQYITYGSCSISATTDDRAYLTGVTDTYTPVDVVKVILTLERWNGSNWTAVKSWEFTETSSSEATGHVITTVSKGYYYRVRAKHSATEGSHTESGYSTSASLYF